MEKVFDTILDGFYKNKVDYKLIIDNKEEISKHKDELIGNVNKLSYSTCKYEEMPNKM